MFERVVVDTVTHIPAMTELPTEAFFGADDQRMTAQATLKYIKWFVKTADWAQRFDAPNTPSGSSWRTLITKYFTKANVSSDAFWHTLIVDFDPHVDDSERDHVGHPKPGFKAYFNLLVYYCRKITDANLDFNNLADDEFEARYAVPPGAVKSWIAAIAPLLTRRVARTHSGRFGLVPFNCEVDDVIAVFHGVPVPFVLRQEGDCHRYRVVGITYIPGIMRGEALRQDFLVHNFCLT